jgi:uncharacterized surface protein with fasciclin (FAS1) repeats
LPPTCANEKAIRRGAGSECLLPIKTLEGGTVTPKLTDGSYTVNGASVVCGNVQTANATVYIISTVLMPSS